MVESWQLTWAEIVEAVERGEVPGDEPELESEQADQRPDPIQGRAPDPVVGNYVLDSAHRGQLLRSTREARGWTVPELARRAEIGPSNIQKIEQNKISNPSFETILKLAIALEVPLDAFATTD